MTTDTGEPPSSDKNDTLSATLLYPVSPAQKPWRPANIFVSFHHAWAGIYDTFRAERNFRFHFLAFVFVILGGILLHLSPLRFVAVLFAVALVMVAELFNTAIEATVDLAMPERHPLAKRAKDASAGAVLVAAIGAVLVGGIVFVPALMPYFRKMSSLTIVLLGTLLVAMVVLVLRRKQRVVEVSSTSTDLSRKMVIGVALIAFTGSSVYQFRESMEDQPWLQDCIVVKLPRYLASPFPPALPFSAGVP